MHNGFLTINSDKMSKSLNNFFTVRQLLANYPGEVIRLVLLSGHYRQPLDFSDDALKVAKATLDKWYRALQKCGPQEKMNVGVSSSVENALLDDMNTPSAIAYLHEYASMLNAPENASTTAEKCATLITSANALGLLHQDPEAWFKWQPSGQSGPTDVEIEGQIAARLAARQAKNYLESDRIRDALAAQGVLLEDSAGKTTWRRG
jgi:cysteinyl-tRNA synthetase